MNDHVNAGKAKVDAELAEWLLVHDRGLTAPEVEAFDAWLYRSPAHGLAWTEAASLWQSFDHAADDEALAKLLDAARSAKPATRSNYSRPRFFVGGGVLIAAAALAWVSGAPRPAPMNAPQAVARQVYSTGLQRARFRLSDATQLTLDAGSELSFSSDAKLRLATLVRGRAYLNVGHDARPFSLRAGGTTITDKGTSFGVASESGVLSVTLVSGKVAILDPATGTGAISLVPGQQFKRVGAAQGAVSAVNVDAVLSWRSGFVEFDRVPLSMAIMQMNRYAAVPVRIGDAKVGGFLVSGRFELRDPRRFASLLALTYPVRLEADAHGRPTLRSN